MGPPVIISPLEAKQHVSIYRKANKAIVDNWKFMQQMLELMLEGGSYDFGIAQFEPDGVWMPNGLKLHYPELRVTRSPVHGGKQYEYFNGKFFTKIYGGLFTENFIQSLSRIAVGEQMLMIADLYRVVMMTHDEVVFLAPAKKADAALEYGIKCMSTPLSWCPDLPFAAEGGHDVCYSK